MSYYNVEEVQKFLEKSPQFKEILYCRGFLITNKDFDEAKYPFNNLWEKTNINDFYYAYIHNKNHIYKIVSAGKIFFLIGHAYNPYTMQSKEMDILESLADAYDKSETKYWEKESELTGVFCIGIVKQNKIMFATDCTGMQMTFYSNKDGDVYVSSHSKLIADFCGYSQTKYVKRLIKSRFYHYWGTFLPGDISPYEEIKRVVPNFKYMYRAGKGYTFKRFFPVQEIEEVSSENAEFVFKEIAEIMRNNLSLIAEKWGDRAAISVTGGRDSTATLSSAKNVYDQLKYFSYQSKETESVDAVAAHKICKALGLMHTIYTIPSEDSDFQDIEILRAIMECNAGCIGANNRNDVRKRAFFINNSDFDVEVKSWVSELGRGEAQNKYGTNKWPKQPSPGYYRCMWKVIVDPWLIVESNKIFRDYIKKYYSEKSKTFLPWMDYFYWEFSWSSGEGTFLTSEHKVSYDITIPYNNRKLLTTIFTIPLKMRIDNQVPIKIIDINNRAIADTGVVVKNAAHTNLWTAIIRTYLRIFSKWGIW